jgi:hypothetical protein
MDDDTLSRENSFDSVSSYDGDLLVSTEIPANSQFDEKIVDFLKCICCNKR